MSSWFALAVATAVVGWLASIAYNRIKKAAYKHIESISDTLARKFFKDEKFIRISKKFVKFFLSISFELFCLAVAVAAGIAAGVAIGFFLLPLAPVYAVATVGGLVAGATYLLVK